MINSSYSFDDMSSSPNWRMARDSRAISEPASLVPTTQQPRDQTNWRSRSASPLGSSPPGSSSPWTKPSPRKATISRYDFHGGRLGPGSMLFLQNSEKAKQNYVGKAKLVEMALDHPVLVIKVNDDSVEILQCTSLGGRGNNANEIDYRNFIGIDHGVRGQKFQSSALKNVDIPPMMLTSVLEKPTLAHTEVLEFRFEAFDYLSFGRHIKINQTLLAHILQKIHHKQKPTTEVANNSRMVDTSDLLKLKRKASRMTEMPFFGPSMLSTKKHMRTTSKLIAPVSC